MSSSAGQVKIGSVAGLSDKQLARVRPRLEAFAAEMFEPMARSDQRRWGGVYLRGLMLDGKRKSIEPMAARLEDGDEQCLAREERRYEKSRRARWRGRAAVAGARGRG